MGPGLPLGSGAVIRGSTGIWEGRGALNSGRISISLKFEASPSERSLTIHAHILVTTSSNSLEPDLQALDIECFEVDKHKNSRSRKVRHQDNSTPRLFASLTLPIRRTTRTLVHLNQLCSKPPLTTNDVKIWQLIKNERVLRDVRVAPQCIRSGRSHMSPFECRLENGEAGIGFVREISEEVVQWLARVDQQCTGSLDSLV